MPSMPPPEVVVGEDKGATRVEKETDALKSPYCDALSLLVTKLMQLFKFAAYCANKDYNLAMSLGLPCFILLLFRPIL